MSSAQILLDTGNDLLKIYQCRLLPWLILVITAWDAAQPNSHVLPRFEYANGRLHVPEDGLYYVYMQIYFN